MNIVLSWDTSVTSSSNKANIEAAVQQAATELGNAITNNITVNIAVGWGEDSGYAVTGNTWGLGGPTTTTLPYSTLTNALKTAAAASGNASLTANLPATDPFGATWTIGSAEAQALGLGSLFASASTPSSPDGSVGFNASVNWAYGTSNGIGTSQGDLVAVALHELAHALGRVDFPSGAYDALNLYTYAAPGRLPSQATTDYFSVDGGATNLNNFDTVSDYGDWASSVTGDAFGYGSQGTQGKLTFTDLLVMESLGYTLAPAYNVTGPASANPGSTVTFTVQTVNVPNGTSVNYTISGLSASELSSGALSGTTTIQNGTGTITLGLSSSMPLSATTSATVSVANGQATDTVGIGGAAFSPGAITDAQILPNTTAQVTSLSYHFSVNQLPANGTGYSWVFSFFGSKTGDSGAFSIGSNGYGNQSGSLGSEADFTVWNAASGTPNSSSNVTLSTYGGTDPSVTESLPFNLTAGTDYTVTINQASNQTGGSTLTATLMNDATSAFTTIGTITANSTDNLLSGSYVASTEVNGSVASATDVAPVLATWSSLVAGGVAGMDNSSAPYNHSTLATGNGVDYATILSPTGFSEFAGGSGNNTLTLASGSNTVWLGSQADNVQCGSSGLDTINCAAQNETVTMGGSAATVSGSTASTLVAFSGPMANYSIASNASGYTVTDNTGTNGLATLQDVNFLRFSDKTVYVGPALTDASGALTGSANVDALYIAVDGTAPGYLNSALYSGLSAKALATQLLAQANLTDNATALKTVFGNLGLSTTGDSGPSTDAANNQAGLYNAMVYLLQHSAAIQNHGGLGYAVGWLGDALAVINTAKSSSYAAYSAAASSFDTQIANAHAYSLQLTNSSPENIATVSVGMTGVLTQPLDQAA